MAVDPAVRGRSIHEAFEQQARSTPDRVAVIHGDKELSYRQLNRTANRIAGRLRERGVTRGTLVGVHCERTEWLVPALLAVLKAGGAYVPLDPAYPAERLALIVSDAQLDHVVTGAGQPLPWLGGADAVLLSADPVADGFDAAVLDHNLDVAGEASDAAYVIYTSGSTGHPKGVVVEHRHTLNLVRWVVRSHDPEELRGSLFAASICFDFSVMEVFPPLLSGGTVIQAENVLALTSLPARDRVTLVSAVPSVASTLLHDPLPPNVRSVNLGGEPVSGALVERVYANPGVRRVRNLYGPTECTTCTTCYEIPRGASDPVPLGHPVDGAVLTVRDEQGRQVPDGTVGELWVDGPVVARGYLHRPEQTAAAFVQTPGYGRAYRTGDLVSVIDGLLHFHGRADQQVKVRGFRIELGEVESALVSHPLVHHAVVLAASDEHGVGGLIGFAECAEAGTGDRPDERVLRAYLTDQLPEYMVPGRIMMLARIPVTDSGKADRQALAALPVPVLDLPDAVVPRNDTERRLLDIAAVALGRGGFGVLDRFADLGGHSLTAARICAEAAAAFGVPLSPIDVLAGSSVADLARVITERTAATPGAPPRRQPAAVYPATAAQREFWMIRELGGPNATTVALRFQLAGVSEVAVVRRALDAVVQRHEVLRCRYGLDPDGRLSAQLAAPTPVEMVEVAADELESRTRWLVDCPFALDGAGPVLRAVVARTTDALELVVATDHLVFDGWSVGVLMRELAGDLAAVLRGEPPATAGDRLQVGDLGRHEERLFAERAAVDAEHWCRVLTGASSLHDLPGTPTGGHGVGRHHLALPADLGPAVIALAARLRVTPFAVYLAALAVVLNGLSGRADLVLSAPYARRGHAGTDKVIGPLLGMLPIRVEVTPGKPFTTLADEVARATAEGLGHTDLSFEDMVAAVDRAPGAPALAVMLSLQPATVPVSARADEVRIDLVTEVRGGGNPDVLSCYLNETVDGLGLAVEYPQARFGPADAESLAQRLVLVLDAVLADPDRAAGTVGLLSDDELRAVRRWGDVPADAPALPLVESVLRQARTRPDHIAVDAPDGELSYAELDQTSARVAAALHAAGMSPGEIVAVCLPRVRRLPAVMFGVARAGGTFLPLDPEHPVDRLAYQVGDCEVRLLLTAADCAPIAAAIGARHPGVRVLDIGALPAGRSPDTRPDPDALCYVLYTSGSTGRPKGVEVSHGNLGVNLTAMRDVMRVGADDVVLSVSPISFDVGHLGIWLPLAVGGRCVLVDRACVLDGHALADRLAAAEATVLFGPPTALRLLLAADWAGKKDLRIMSIGEALDPALSRAITDRVGELWNGYGPTEAAIVTTMYLARGDEEHSVPIGSPLPGYRVHVVDEAGRPVPPGVAGELWIAGPAVSRRYRNRPEVTARAFGRDPRHPDDPLYRTGDLVRWLPDGRLDFIGRRDHQVKVRGHRVELGEIESVLREHPYIADAAVVTAQPAGETVLVGYLVWRGQPDLPAVRDFLTAGLPSYMVPQRWVSLPELPLNSSGKVDRKALPAPADADRPQEPPRTVMQEFVAGIWAEVLRREQVYADDDFFALGGHSFAATRVAGRLRDALDADIPVRLLFDHPVLSAFADVVERVLLSGAETEA